MRSAARGALPLPAEETLEVLVYMAQHPLFGQEARMTLAGWDPQSALEVLGKDTATPEVLLYYWQPENRRPVLMPTLIENAAIPESLLMELADTASRETVKMLLASARARSNPGVVEALLGNANLNPEEAQELQGGGPAEAEAAPQQPEQALEEFEVVPDPESAAALEAFQREHAAAIAAEEDKPFELVKDEEPAAEVVTTDAASVGEEIEESATAVASTGAQGGAAQGAIARGIAPENIDDFDAAEKKKLTVLQRVSKLNVGQRIKLGFIGGKEERALLIRDTARLVQNAVLSSPKLTDAEAESFAASKNLQENVFREIARQRRFLKLYPVVRNLANNPRCPLDISLTLVKTLHVYDLKSLRHNKNVPDTIRKVAAKLYTEKASRGGAKKE
jgi:hypothetical protein